jgi:6-phosphofructokinase 1
MVLNEKLSKDEIINKLERVDLDIDDLGKRTIDNPIKGANYITDDIKTIYITDERVHRMICQMKKKMPAFEIAGPRKKIYFDPNKTRCAVVTCGGLCPGLNDVIRAIIMELYWVYGVKKDVYGIRYGLRGFIPKYGDDFLMLNPTKVKDIHKEGGTILGTSRGPQSNQKIIDTLERHNINILFVIGGDGTLRAAEELYQEISQRELKISLVCVPKTIDNDIPFIQRSFGFETAFSIATTAIRAAHNEAEGAYNGIGLVKLMGRRSGFIAANAALGLRDVNFLLVPEMDFDLDGENGLFVHLENRLATRNHSVIVVAEGAGQKFFKDQNLGKDASGNPRLGDIGVYLKKEMGRYFKEKDIEVNIKYIDPSYMVRAIPANENDSAFAGILAQSAVHAGMAGKTGIVIGRWNNEFTHVPIKTVNRYKKSIEDVNINFWYNVVEATGQPLKLTND